LTDLATLIARARAWAETDPDPQTRRQALDWINAEDEEALREAFGARLAFGTAGLRGALGAGPNRMNRALVRRVATGLARYLLEVVPGAASKGLVIGFDARLGSRDFSDDTAAIFADHGFRVWLNDEEVPTPRLAHAVVQLGACAGVMVTASHNPPQDNGYKVYWANGAQIIEPHDTGISRSIDALVDFDARTIGDLSDARKEGLVMPVPDAVHEDYFARVQALHVHSASPLRIVYTAMHGVGGASVMRSLREAGYTQVFPVAEQFEPDGRFPTVKFPNPEEPGALDLALARCREVEADLLIANDPDGDRLAVAVPNGTGGYRALTGNEVGALLGHDLLTYGDHGGRTPMVATTVVSSKLLSRIAAAGGAAYAETLTGFKWIANAAIAHDERGGRFVLGYEEALGYSAGDVARDKDGVSAAVLFADLASHCQQRGISVLDQLANLYAQHGLHASAQHSITMPGLSGQARIRTAMEALRASPPRVLGGVEVERFVDISIGTVLNISTGQVSPLDLPQSDVLCWELADGSRLVARPSGTEPKIKFYAEVRQAYTHGTSLASAEAEARSKLMPLVQDLLRCADLT
jgi:phosphomannomutase